MAFVSCTAESAGAFPHPALVSRTPKRISAVHFFIRIPSFGERLILYFPVENSNGSHLNYNKIHEKNQYKYQYQKTAICTRAAPQNVHMIQKSAYTPPCIRYGYLESCRDLGKFPQIEYHWQSPQIFVLFPVSIIFFCTASVNSGNASF